MALLSFNKALSEEDVAYVRDKLQIIKSKEITWSAAEGSRIRFLSAQALFLTDGNHRG